MLENEKAKISANIDNLDKLIKSLNASDYFVRVGIIGEKATAKHDKKDGDNSLTNAELGTIHEQPNNDGVKIPKRSFLEMPLKLKLDFNGEAMKEIKKAMFKQLFIKRNAKAFFEYLGDKCWDIVNHAFETNGYGEWQPWSEGYLKRRASKIKGKKKRENFMHLHNILTDTGKLRNSITFKVMKQK